MTAPIYMRCCAEQPKRDMHKRLKSRLMHLERRHKHSKRLKRKRQMLAEDSCSKAYLEKESRLMPYISRLMHLERTHRHSEQLKQLKKGKCWRKVLVAKST